MKVRDTGCSVVGVINELWGVPYIGNGGGSAVGKQQFEVPGSGRLRNLEAPAHVLRAWELVIAASQVLNAACLESSKEVPNGEALWGVLRKGIADV